MDKATFSSECLHSTRFVADWFHKLRTEHEGRAVLDEAVRLEICGAVAVATTKYNQVLNKLAGSRYPLFGVQAPITAGISMLNRPE